MREENFGPVVNPDRTPTETTLQMMGIRVRPGDSFRWYPDNSDYPSVVTIIKFTPNGALVDYTDDPIDDPWEIPWSEI